MDIFALLLISVPIFYIYGIVCFFRNFGDKKNKGIDHETLTEAVIKELAKESLKTPRKTLSELLDEYKQRNLLVGDEAPNNTPEPQTTHLEKPVEQKTEPSESIFASWYSNNSINLLLYIGAFFIVAAAAIFVGFQWETISGVTKALLLTLVTVAFFSFGYWFYLQPKIKNAGITFIAISAVLIPVCGAAWYNFVLRDSGVPIGIAWLVTSMVALTVYLYLALFLKHSFYAYASTISTFSLLLSLVNSFNMAKDFYVLAGIIACFLLFIISQKLQHEKSELSDMLVIPSELSSQVAMPITLVYGFTMAISQDKLFSLASVLSAFIATLFYFLGYKFSKKTWKFALSEVLLLLAMYLLCNWVKLPEVIQYYVIAITTVCLAGQAYYYRRDKKVDESDISLVIALFSSIIVFIVARTNAIAPIPLTLLSLAPILIAVMATIIKKTPYPLLIASSFLAILVYIVYIKVLSYALFPEYLGILYLLFAISKYTITTSMKKTKEVKEVGFGATALYSLLSMVFSFNNHPALITVSLGIAALFFATSIIYKAQSVNYAGVSFVVLALTTLLSELHIPLGNYPLILCMFSFGLFFIAQLSPKHMQVELLNASLLTSVLTNMFFFLTSQNAYPQNPLLERNALLSAYGTTILFAADYSVRKKRSYAYATSVVALCTLLWQIMYLGFTNSLFYTTPIGLYFMTIAYSRRLFNDPNNEKLFNLISVLLLLLPPLTSSFDENATVYSVILGLEGIILVMLGITFSQKMFRYAGVAAIVLSILPQTYSYILALPRWLIVGILGIVFLAVAIFLLLKRKEDH